MILYLIDKEALLMSVRQYIDECGGVLDGQTDTQHILELIESAPTKASWVVKGYNDEK